MSSHCSHLYTSFYTRLRTTLSKMTAASFSRQKINMPFLLRPATRHHNLVVGYIFYAPVQTASIETTRVQFQHLKIVLRHDIQLKSPQLPTSIITRCRIYYGELQRLLSVCFKDTRAVDCVLSLVTFLQLFSSSFLFLKIESFIFAQHLSTNPELCFN